MRQISGPPRLAPLYARAVLAARRRGGDLPDEQLVRTAVEVDREHLAAYSRVCGFAVADRLPVTYPHVLGFGLQLELMTGPGFPYPLLGLVHIANTFHQERAIDAGERLELRVGAGEPGEHPRGRTFVITTEVRAGGGPVWTGRSTYLHRGGGSESGKRRSEPPVLEGPANARWDVAADAGRRYAEVSGDRNPIHLHALTARPFGFRRPIAHGMWTAARCLATLEPRTPDAVRAEVEFAAPVQLPSTVDFFCRQDGDRWKYALHGKGGRRHLGGTVAPA